MEHPTAEPDNVSIDTKRTRLTRDLESLACVESVREDSMHRGSVVFHTTDPDLPVDVLRVLVDHDCFLPGKGPTDPTAHQAIIHDSE